MKTTECLLKHFYKRICVTLKHNIQRTNKWANDQTNERTNEQASEGGLNKRTNEWTNCETCDYYLSNFILILFVITFHYFHRTNERKNKRASEQRSKRTNERANYETCDYYLTNFLLIPFVISKQANEWKGERSLLTLGRVELTRTYSSLLYVK